MDFNFYIPTKIIFGIGEFSKIKHLEMPGKKALIVISFGNSVKKNGYLAKLEEQLNKMGIKHVIYDKVLPNPTKTNIMEASQVLKDNNCDFIIGFGGGSCIDAAKAIGIMANNEGDLWDYFTSGSGKGKAIKNLPLPVVTITTTAGTGSEANPFMVITNTDTKEKMGFASDCTFPYLSIVDPELTRSIPSNLSTFQGFDALFHSVEGYLNKKASPISDIFAIKSISLIGKSLVKVIRDGSNISARADVSLASTLAGFVQAISDCTSEHSIEHAMSGLHQNLPHGAWLIMISKAYFTHFAHMDICEDRMKNMAGALGKKDVTSAMDFVDALDSLISDSGVCLAMSDYGIRKEEFEEIEQMARVVGPRMFLGDPEPLTKEDVLQILNNSYL